jgi:hypothetical protein
MDTLDANGFVSTVVKVSKKRHNSFISLEKKFALKNMDCDAEVARVNSKWRPQKSEEITEED